MKKSAGKAKGAKGTRKKGDLKDLRASKSGSAKGGTFTPNPGRFDPYKNFKF